MCADSLYGDNDPIHWPQPYNQYNCHHGAIPRPHLLADHLIMWWEPTLGAFIPLKDSASPFQGLGKLSDSKMDEMKSLASVLLSRIQVFVSNSQVPLTLSPIMKMMEHGLVCLESVWTTFR